MVNKLIHWHYWMEAVRLATFVLVAFLLIFAITAYSHGQANQNKVLKKVEEATDIIKTQQAKINAQNDTITSLSKEIKTDTDSIHQQATCIFLFFSQPQSTRDSTSVTYPPECVTTSSGLVPKVAGSP